jgi:CRP-like cAMP-binding protein
MLRQTGSQVAAANAPRPGAGSAPAINSLFDSIDLNGVTMSFDRNADIFGEGEPADYVYKVLSGSVRTYRVLSDGRRQITGFHLPGDLLGLEPGEEHPCSAEAINPSTVLVVKRSAVLAVAEREGDVARKLWAITARQLREAQDGAFAQGLLEQDRVELRQRLMDAEERFRAAAKGRAQAIEWRSALADPTSYVAQQARAADLIITGTNRDGWALDPARRLDPSALVMQAGRPVFFVPPEVEWIKLDTVLIAWKDTREARRAVWDALPLLQRAREVTIVEVLEGGKVPRRRAIASTTSPDGWPGTASSPTPWCLTKPKARASGST